MKCKKWLLCAVSVLLVLSLCACGSVGKSASLSDSYNENSAASAEKPQEDIYLSQEAESSEIALPENQKFIQTVDMSVETEDMDDLLSQINARITELGGYVEAQQIFNGSIYSSSRYRSAELTVRIPAEKLEQFTDRMADVSNITRTNKTVENITLTYVATESRVKALETEQTRLLELLAQAQSMADILTIEERLTDVRAELEQVTSTLRVYDNQVSYSTVNLEISEVREYTVVTEPETVWERIAEGFMESLRDIGDGAVEFFVWFVSNILYILLVVAAVVLFVLWVRRRRGNRRKKKASATGE